MMKKIDNKLLFFLLIIYFFFFISFNGGVHLFDWDEINFAEIAREMIVTKDYLNVKVNYLPFHEKPPLFMWLQVLSMKLFGINEFAARFPNVICGLITMFILFLIGKKLVDNKFGYLWIITYCCSFLPFFYFKSGIIDPWYNLFIFLSLYFIIKYFESLKSLEIVFSAFFCGLALLTKGPVAILILLLTTIIYCYFSKEWKKLLSIKNLFLYIVVVFFVGGIWFFLQILNGHFDLVKEFIKYQIRLFTTKDAGHGGFFLYHFVVLLIGVFPASIFGISYFVKRMEVINRDFNRWMVILFWVVLILFTIVKTKIVHYSSLCYFPLTYLATQQIYFLSEGKLKIFKWQKVLVIIISTLFLLINIGILFINKIIEYLQNSDLIKDKFAIANLQAEVYWPTSLFFISFLLLFGLIIFFVYEKKKFYLQSILFLFISFVLYTYISIIFLVPRIEKYSQNAAIEFFKSLQNKDIYIETLGYKSYAHLFYSKKKQPIKLESYDTNWLLTGNIDKPAYFSLKITKKEEYFSKYSELQELYEKNGFVFCVRYPKTK